MTQEVRVVAIVDARPGQATAVAEAIAAVVAPTLKEPGCHEYVPHRDTEDGNRFVFVERWESAAALDAHNRSPHLQAFAAAIGPLLAAPLRVLVLEALG